MKPLYTWEPWFAWHPVDVGFDIVWLSWVERQRVHSAGDDGYTWAWIYRRP